MPFGRQSRLMSSLHIIDPVASTGHTIAESAEIARKIADLQILHRGLCGKIDQLLRWGGAILSEIESNIAHKQRLESQMRGLSWVDTRSLAVYASTAPAADGVLPMADAIRENVIAALNQAGGNKTKAARLLGITRRAFLRRAEKCGIPPGHRYPRKTRPEM